jgi:SAM-dependent methyltransferase
MPAYDFGYSWTFTHGHLIVTVAAAALAAAALWLHWPRWMAVVAGITALWAFGGFLVVQLVFGANTPVELPTASFLSSGRGRVVDLGAGSGRSTVMVLLARPQAHVTAFDLYSGYFGIDDNTPARVRANVRAAGAEDRFDVRTGDMRALPFEATSFDAAVSVASIDHLDADGVRRALGEANRVLRPGGEMLLEVINIDAWVKFAYPLPHGHSHYFTHGSPAERWRSALETAGFTIAEQGTRPAMLYFLARKPR